MSLQAEYELKKQEALRQFYRLKADKNITLKPKSTTHFMRRRVKSNTLNLHALNRVLEVNTQENYVEAEGLATFYDIFEATAQVGYMPVVVPEFRNITVGGAIAGLGVEASSFKYGLVHENILEMEVLTGKGEVVVVSENKHRDLFISMPNSLGTIGYILKCKLRIVPIKKFIGVELLRFNNARDFFSRIKMCSTDDNLDFLEGVVFSPDKFVLLLGYLRDSMEDEGKLFDIYRHAWFRYLETTRDTHIYFTPKDYMWRWDADAFWGTKELGVLGELFNISLFREALLKPLLRSDRLLKIHHTLAYHPALPNLFTTLFGRKEQFIQDVGIEIDKCAEFMSWYGNKIAVYPIWICPVRKFHDRHFYPLYQWQGNLIVDIGFYSYKKLIGDLPAHYYTKLVEQKLLGFKGIKGLYSTSFFTPEEFWSMHDRERYLAAERIYDPDSVFPELYDKVVGHITK